MRRFFTLKNAYYSFNMPNSITASKKYASASNTKNFHNTTLHISTDILHKFSPQIKFLRKAAAPQNDPSITDHIDDQCCHLVLYHNSVLIGSVRISSSTTSTYKQQCKQFPFPTGPSIAELTKAVVLPTYQNKGLYKLMMLEVLLRLPGLGYNEAIAGVRPAFPLRSFLKSLGFIEYPKTVLVEDKKVGCQFEGIPVCLKHIDIQLIKQKYFTYINYLKNKNLIIESTLPEEPTIKFTR